MEEEYTFSEMDALYVLQKARQRTELLEILSQMADFQTRNSNAGKRKTETAKELEKLLTEKIASSR